MAPAALSAQGLNPQGQQLNGSWIGELNIPGFPQLKVFMTYTPDGSILATSSNNSIAESTQFGAWVRTGDRLFSLVVLGFVYDEKGNYQGSRKIRATITLSEKFDEFSGDGEADILAPDGTVVASVPTLAVHGKRILVEATQQQKHNDATQVRPPEGR
jgi:hypothetical protein